MQRSEIKNEKEHWKNFNQISKSFIQKKIFGQLIDNLKCESCGKKVKNYSHFLSLQLSIPSNFNEMYNKDDQAENIEKKNFEIFLLKNKENFLPISYKIKIKYNDPKSLKNSIKIIIEKIAESNDIRKYKMFFGAFKYWGEIIKNDEEINCILEKIEEKDFRPCVFLYKMSQKELEICRNSDHIFFITKFFISFSDEYLNNNDMKLLPSSLKKIIYKKDEKVIYPLYTHLIPILKKNTTKSLYKQIFDKLKKYVNKESKVLKIWEESKFWDNYEEDWTKDNTNNNFYNSIIKKAPEMLSDISLPFRIFIGENEIPFSSKLKIKKILKNFKNFYNKKKETFQIKVSLSYEFIKYLNFRKMKKKSDKKEKISLNLIKSKPKQIPKLEDTFKEFSKKEFLKWKCEKCETTQTAVKNIEISSVSDYIIVQFKHHERKKMVNLPVNNYIDLSQIFPNIKYSPGLVKPKKESSDFKYSLKGIIRHFGSLNSGHYISLIKKHGTWYQFNDDYVTEVDESKIDNPNNYILLLEKI